MSRGKQTFMSQSVKPQPPTVSLLPSSTIDPQPSKSNEGLQQALTLSISLSQSCQPAPSQGFKQPIPFQGRSMVSPLP